MATDILKRPRPDDEDSDTPRFPTPLAKRPHAVPVGMVAMRDALTRLRGLGNRIASCSVIVLTTALESLGDVAVDAQLMDVLVAMVSRHI